jgi:hypothetical protein
MTMYRSDKTEPESRTKKTLARVAAAALFSVILGASGPAFAGPHGGGAQGGGFHGGGFHAGRFHGGFNHGFYPGFGLGLALGSAYPWGWGYYSPGYDYYGDAGPYTAAQVWYYCSNPTGYYPYVTQCYGPWQVVPAG